MQAIIKPACVSLQYVMERYRSDLSSHVANLRYLTNRPGSTYNRLSWSSSPANAALSIH
ncbi:hypothetical protein J007_06432 [Cryptococcus neoformans]|nr:hypothetical protein J007_06432 [Cryptococcus neoformans var. grubii]OXC58021.1 hypothetical protein C358_06527 [Cryptococcus neoformans var. grubii MW-RSA852]